MNTISLSNQQFKALVPASQYKGPILKLTPKDKEKIARLMDAKTELLFEQGFLEKLLAKKKKIIESSGLISRISHIEAKISQLEEEIKNIKMNRLKQQKSKSRKIDLMM